NLRREKGHDLLLDAAPAVLARFPDARFEIVGAGPERDGLTRRARDRGIADAVDFVGHVDNVPARLPEADVFVLPSRSEACPNAVLEAMAAALPVVATKVGGVPEIVEHDRNGLLVAPNDPRALAAGICDAMADRDRAARLGTQARRDIASRFSFDRMV